MNAQSPETNQPVKGRRWRPRTKTGTILLVMRVLLAILITPFVWIAVQEILPSSMAATSPDGRLTFRVACPPGFMVVFQPDGSNPEHPPPASAWIDATLELRNNTTGHRAVLGKQNMGYLVADGLNLIGILWSSDSRQFLYVFSVGNATHFKVYDIDAGAASAREFTDNDRAALWMRDLVRSKMRGRDASERKTAQEIYTLLAPITYIKDPHHPGEVIRIMI